MTKSHGRKSRARKTSRRQGAAFAAANAGTLHDHQSGPSNTDLRPADPGRWGAESAPDMRAAAALIGACIEECVSCRRSLSGKLLEADPIVLAVTAGAVFGLHAACGADAQDFAAQPAEVFFLLVDRARAAGDDFRVLTATAERMPLTDHAQLLDEALDLWASYGRQYPDLLRSENLARALLWSHTPALALNARSGATPNRAEPRQPSKESQFPMSERTDDITVNAENAARTFAELVAGLQREGIVHPVQAQRVDALLTRSAGELKAVLTVLRACVEELQEQGLLMTDYRGEPLDRVLHRYTEASAAAEELAGDLGQADNVMSEDPRPGDGPGADYLLAVLAADLQQQGITYPLEAYRIYSFLTRCAGEMRTALALLHAWSQEGRPDVDVRRYAASSFTAVQLAGALGTAYSASGRLAYNEEPSRGA
ncbi:hypothetical protein [Streptomyces sp. NBC_00687]|uniref:hypothetical protein n=1 Tax=Streptomyces sp. NBC_00687 TaxID=2975807 RepID=UPI0022510160|nr:hypothetical protein [Streptomyces sp. NBC_00687]MCX4920072.1 hypothetical protein [Streptomyces sp. NBC_00687]